MDLLYLSDHQTRRRPQAGTPCKLSWQQFAEWLSTPVWGTDKTEAGGYSPAKYRDNIRHLDKLELAWALVFDIDEIRQGESIKDVAKAVAAYSCIVHETFSSTKIKQRCRLIVETKSAMDAGMYEVVHKKFRQTLNKCNVWPDEHATDASRLSYCPVRLPDTGYQFELTSGEPLDAALLGKDAWFAGPPRVTDAGTSKAHATVTRQYVESAVASARHNMEMAREGSRHATLLKESLSLSRSELGLSLGDVEEALFGIALSRMGPSRTHEIQAAIRSGFSKMRERSGQ